MKFAQPRRRFLELLGISSVILGAPLNALSKVVNGRAAKSSLPFEHIVVLMLENRSFDNMLGYLYAPEEQSHFEGVIGKRLSNPIPAYAKNAERKVVPVARGYAMDHPNPDPSENHPHVNTQLFGAMLPDANSDGDNASPSFNSPNKLPAHPIMKGFVADYIDTCKHLFGHDPTYNQYKAIMQCFPPQAVPVISALAKSFAVCDHWFCDVPSNTFSNRCFFHSASSGGLVNDSPISAWLDMPQETIFNRMSKHGVSWNIYYDKKDPFPLTALIHYSDLKSTLDQHFLGMDSFYQAVEEGSLPQYSFIEPRFFVEHNDEHPPILPAAMIYGGPSSVLAGELLIHQVYDAIRRSNSPQGSNYENTLLAITYDEHGGCFDHVPPPAAVPPDSGHVKGQMGFAFDRLGVRVPMVLVSSYIEAGTVVNDQLQHTSMIRTMSDKWNLGHLSHRDRTAPDIGMVFNRTNPRIQSTWPVTKPRPVTPSTNDNTNLHGPLNELQTLVMRTVQELANRTSRKIQDIATMTVYDALVEMDRVKRELGLVRE